MNLVDLSMKIHAHIGGAWVLTLSDDTPNGDISIRDIKPYLEEKNPEEVEAFWAEYPKLTDHESVHKVVVVNNTRFTDVRTVYEEGESQHAFGHECLLRLHRLFFNCDPEAE